VGATKRLTASRLAKPQTWKLTLAAVLIGVKSMVAVPVLSAV